MKFATITLGCKVNTYDTEAIEEILISNGYTLIDFENIADIYIINTCTVTNLGDKKSRQMIQKAKKINPNAIIIVTGCYSQVNPKLVASIEGVNIVLGTKDRLQINTIIEDYLKSDKSTVSYVEDIMKETVFENLKISGLKNKTRAYLKIQEGCNRYCSYCIIPFARGRLKSRAPEHIINEVNVLAQNGFKEIVLAGIHVGSYGKDLKNTNLLDILNKVSLIDGIERIRFSSIDPSIIDEDFVNTISSNSKICNHFHLSLQSGCNKTLSAMNRPYSIDDYTNSLYLLRNKIQNVNITTDIIVGFPGETENDFLESLNYCEKAQFGKMHVFPFSRKEGTKAYSMDNQINENIKKQRVNKFLELDKNLSLNFIQKNLNQNVKVLIEKNTTDNFYVGHTTNYLTVQVQSNTDIKNKVTLVHLENNNELIITGILF